MEQINQQTTLNEAVERYRLEMSKYQNFADYIHRLVNDYCDQNIIHATEYRSKDVESFRRKLNKTRENGLPRYSNPLSEITDLAGVRVIVFTKDSVDIICDQIAKILKVTEFEDVGDRVYSQGKFGYQSKHMLIKLGDDRVNLFENRKYTGLICEIQVRTILQHAWAEMEHDIQYKSDQEIPTDLKKRFSALAGLIEIADREFQNIQQDSQKIKSVVRNELISDLTRQGFVETSGDVNGAQVQSAAARELVGQGKNAEAIEIYSSKIELEPNSYTLYIGRAKAKFLAGDLKGALADLGDADRISGDPASTSALRVLIERGDINSVLVKGAQAGRIASGLADATRALELGDGVKAFEEYNSLESLGYNKAFVLFGKAMACILESDVEGTRRFLDQLNLRPATPMAVNILALRAVVDLVEGASIEAQSRAIEGALNDMPNYTFDASPLKVLQTGISRKGLEPAVEIQNVFEKVRRINTTPLAERQ